MANTNSTTPTPTPVQAQQPGNQQPLLAYDPTHEDSAVDVCGYAALLRELTETSNTEGR